MTPDEAVRAATWAARKRSGGPTSATSRPARDADAILLEAPSHIHLAYRPGVPLIAHRLQGRPPRLMEVRWRGFFRVKDPEAARVVTKRLPGDLRLVRAERYWKNAELHEVHLVCTVNSPTFDAAAWFEGSLTTNDGGRFRVAGLEWLEFELRATASPTLSE